MFTNPFSSREKFDAEEFFALTWKKPDRIAVLIREVEDGYFVKVTSFKEDNVVTQAQTGQELFEMVNAAVYDYLDIPEVYRKRMGYFLPPEELREDLKIKIPAKFLNKEIGLVKA